jgi:hypothetical protein
MGLWGIVRGTFRLRERRPNDVVNPVPSTGGEGREEPEGPLRQSAERLDYLYREYVRLGEYSDSYIRSSFEDFKLLGAIGALLVWPPIAGAFDEDSSGSILLVGFIAILFIVAILGVRNLLKVSVIAIYIEQLERLEAEIRAELGTPQTKAFRLAESWVGRGMRRQGRIALRFHLLFIVLLGVFPNLVLGLEAPAWEVAVYAPLALFAILVFINAARVMQQEIDAAVRAR